ncbi:DegT/DnrJ/EryC1/StrS family aminotransferase [Candidatus Latescibacterota bacterium]
MMWRCDLVPQYEAYKDEILDAVSRVLSSGRYTLATEVGAFEKEFALYSGTKHAVGVNSGTDALILSLIHCGVKKGDEVVTTPFTAIPTYAAIRFTGAKPVFVDIEPDTFLMDISKVSEAITERTKAVVPVHLFGNAIDVEKLREIVGSNIRIIEDCAQAHGAMVRGKKTGSLGDFGAFSFYPTKNLGGYGDGGIITTQSDEDTVVLRKRRMYGMINKDEFDMDGINSRLDELQAAILRVKLQHLDAMNAKRAELDRLYRDLLPEECCPQVVHGDVDSVYHVYSAICSSYRDELVDFLDKRGIQSNIYYPMPLYNQEGYLKAYDTRYELHHVEDVAQRIIALPFYPEMSSEAVKLVTDSIKEFYTKT